MKRTVAIAANFTIEPILPVLKSYLDKLGLEHNVEFAPYNQIFQQLLDPSSLFYRNRTGVNLLFLRIEDLGVREKGLDGLESNIEELACALVNSEQFKVPVFVFVCPPSVEGRDGDFRLCRLGELEALLIKATGTIQNIHFIGTRHVPSRYSIGGYDNPKGNKLAHVPYSEDFFAAIAIETVRKIDAHFRRPQKVMVLDCDNTLWDGVCGEDGADRISFCDSRLALQRFAAEQSREGMLVCLCSKNNESDVWDVFDRRSEMPLKREHLVSWRINWEPKSSNLRSLAAELQLGLDSFIFVDDDPAVCAEVRENCPEVFTFLLPRDTDRIPSQLDHLWLFDRLKVTDEDRKRTEGYKREVARERVKQESSDLASFLEGLKLVCEIGDMRNDQIPRVSQLSLRTNQFNSTTIRRSEADLSKIVSDRKKHIWTVDVKDRFGDYGLVGMVCFEANGEALRVNSLMLSCRALGRGVEHWILRELGSKALNLGIGFVDIEFRQTEKNIPIRKFLDEIEETTKQETDGGTIFRISAAAAASAIPKYNATSDAEPKSDLARPVDAREKLYTGASHEVYIEIASTLSQGILSLNGTRARSVDRQSLSAAYAPARSETERRLLQIWEKLLKRTGIGIFDDFFELGGDSLLGVSLFVEIEETFGRALPLPILIESASVAKLAKYLDENPGDTGRKYLVSLQDGGNERPLFCMHAAGGNVLFYRDLARELGPDQPVYGLQARGVADKTETAHDRVEDMAAAYLVEIRSFQSNGPYRLCGSSFGGLVAFEVAKRLTQIGEEVELLALFDTYAPGYLKNRGVDKSVNSNVIERIKNLNNQIREIPSIRARMKFVASKVQKLRVRLKRKVLWKKNQFAIQYSKSTGKELPVDLQRNHKAIQKALDNYIPSVYDGPVVLFRATDQPKNVNFEPRLGWDNFAKSGIRTFEVKGTHGALTVYPFAEDLARKLKPLLTENVNAGRRER